MYDRIYEIEAGFNSKRGTHSVNVNKIPNGINKTSFALRLSDAMQTANSKRVKIWKNEKLDWSMQCNVSEGSMEHMDEGSSTMTTSIKSQVDMEIEEESASQPTSSAASVVPYFKKLNLSMVCNISEDSTVTTPIKDQSDMSIEEESTSQPTSPAAIAVSLRKSTKLDKVFAIPDEILARRKRHLKFANEDSGTPLKSQKDYQNMKGKICRLAPEYPSRARKSSLFCTRKMFLLLLTIVVVFISVFLYENQSRKHSSDFANAVAELKKRIYGQDQAIHALSEYLQLDTPCSKIIILVGGTGVGKSYTVEIIKKNFPRKYAVRQYFPPIGAVSTFNFPFLYPNLIILENLKEKDLKDAVNFLKRHQETCKNRFVTVLAVFNFEQMDDHLFRSINMYRSLNALEISFTDENVNVAIIPYNSLNEDALQKCIVDAMKETRLTLTEKQLYLVKQTLQINNAGCKGAYNKVQIIGRQESSIAHDFL